MSDYPYVIVRIACCKCPRRGQYRLARLAAKYGPEAFIYDVIYDLSRDCPMQDPRGKFEGENCRPYLPDVEPPPRPPDLPPQMFGATVTKGERLWRIVKGGTDEDAA